MAAAMSAVGNAARRTSAIAPRLLRAAFARGGGAEPSPRGRGRSPFAALVSFASTRGPLRARSAPPRAGEVMETEVMTAIALPGPPPAAGAQVAGGARGSAVEAPGGSGGRADRVLQVRSSVVSFVNPIEVALAGRRAPHAAAASDGGAGGDVDSWTVNPLQPWRRAEGGAGATTASPARTGAGVGAPPHDGPAV